MTPEEQLAKILKQNQNIVFGKTFGTDADGNCTVQTGESSILARSGGQISAGDCVAMKADDGQWYAVSSRSTGTVSSNLIFKKKSKPVIAEEENSNIIFLFRDTETRKVANVDTKFLTFLVGGDREVPEQCFEIAEIFEDTKLEFVYGSIQKTSINLNSFVVNLIFRKTGSVPRSEDLEEPITYLLRNIVSVDEDGDTDIEDSITIKEQLLLLPQYPKRASPVLLQDKKATLNDRGYYRGFEIKSADNDLISDYCFQYGYFGCFETGEGTIGEVRSGEWHNIVEDPEKDPPPKGFLRPSKDLDSLPQFEPNSLKHQKAPYDKPYDYSVHKYFFDANDSSEYPIKPPYVPPFKGGQSRGVPYTVNIKYRATATNINTGVMFTEIEGDVSINVIGAITDIGSYLTRTKSGVFFGVDYDWSGKNAGIITTETGVYAPLAEFGYYAPTSYTWDILDTEITRTDGQPDTGGDLPPPPDFDNGKNVGCVDTDANNYADIQNPELPDYRNPETCSYNPFKVRGHNRTSIVTFDPKVEANPLLLADPIVAMYEQNLTSNNPLKKDLTDRLLSSSNTSVPTATIPTSRRLAIAYIPKYLNDPACIGADSELLATNFLAVRYDKVRFLTKKTSKYPSELYKIGLTTPGVTSKELKNQYTTIEGFTSIFPYNQFNLDDGVVSGLNNKGNIFEIGYAANYAFDDTVFVVVKPIGLDGKSIDVEAGDTLEIVKTVLGDSVTHTALNAEFVGDKKGTVVDASAYFEIEE